MFDCNSFLKRKNWSQKDLAERLGVTTSAVGMWCIGKATPSYAIILELIKLGMTPLELFGEEFSIYFDKSSVISDYEFEQKVKSVLLKLLK